MFRLLRIVLGAALGLGAIAAIAAEPYPWGQRDPAFSFNFGNGIDSHQISQLRRDGSLSGFLYVYFTSVVTQDGYPVATHVDCNAMPGCSVGWKLDGLSAQATLLQHDESMHDHPMFAVPRSDIPQPGSHVHFHWLGPMPGHHETGPGYLLQLTAMNRFCFIHHMADKASSASSCVDNGGIKVDRGIDTATHLNIVPVAPTHGM